MTALARARASTSPPSWSASALVTALLEAAAGTTSLASEALGLALIAVGAGTVIWMGFHRPELGQGEAAVE